MGFGEPTHASRLVWDSAKWKELGGENPKLKGSEAEIATLFRRLDADTENLETWIDEMQPELMIRSKEIPPYVRTGRTRVLSGKIDEFKMLLRDQIGPPSKRPAPPITELPRLASGLPAMRFTATWG